MTSQQKLIVYVLVLANILIFCCGLPVAIWFMLPSEDQTIASAPTPALKAAPTFPPTAIPSPTLPPTTATRVIPLPATPVLTPAEPGWTLHSLPQDGFAISVPTSWAAQPSDPAALASLMRQVQEKNPQYAKVLGSQAPQMAAAGIKFIAIDLTPQPEAPNFATNLNVLRHTIPSATTFDAYVNTNVKQLQDSGIAKSITRRRVKLPAGDAEEIRYAAAMAITGAEKTQMALTQYLLVRNQQGYVLSFTTDPKLDAKYFPLFEKIVRSLQWTQ
ncbi:MAG: hypothetical protein FJ009_21365 [Chloroflexi bacterium]|nr:hypothetical protein [Chloroflexota bacterium]